MSDTFVIVGAGLAGAKAAETLREEGFDGRVVLLGAEPHRPYERPPLSKDYLRGEAERDAAFVHEEGFYDEHDIELRHATRRPGARRRRPRGRARERRARRLLQAAAGARRRAAGPAAARRRPRRRPLPAHVRGLRHAARGDRARRPRRRRSAPAGSAPRSPPRPAPRGMDVTLVEQLAFPLERVIGREVGEIYAAHPPRPRHRGARRRPASRRSRATGAPSACA